MSKELKESFPQNFRGFRFLQRLIEELFFKTNQSIHEQDTLIFINEIQQVPNAINLIRYFYEEYQFYAVIAVGTLLEKILDETL